MVNRAESRSWDEEAGLGGLLKQNKHVILLRLNESKREFFLFPLLLPQVPSSSSTSVPQSPALIPRGGGKRMKRGEYSTFLLISPLGERQLEEKKERKSQVKSCCSNERGGDSFSPRERGTRWRWGDTRSKKSTPLACFRFIGRLERSSFLSFSNLGAKPFFSVLV